MNVAPPKTFEKWFELGQRLGVSKNRLYQMWIQVLTEPGSDEDRRRWAERRADSNQESSQP